MEMAWNSLVQKSIPAGGLSLRDVASYIRLWHHRARSRRQLRWLDQRQLHDIGIDRADALKESYKPFWRG
jgi:uncharacterized protein YjiS (DUF1127 family)